MSTARAMVRQLLPGSPMVAAAPTTPIEPVSSGAPIPVRRVRLIALMAATIFMAAGLAYWSSAREENTALAELARGQATLARGLSLGLSEGSFTEGPRSQELSRVIHDLEQPGRLRVLIARPGASNLEDVDHHLVESDVLKAALLRGRTDVRLTREEAAAIGLSKRTAVAGVYQASERPPWAVVVVSSAGHERDREIHANWRLLVSILVVAGIVAAFGGIALREQRKELALAAELAIAAAREQRQTQLLRADKLATLGTFATGVTHEIATPLGVIAGRAEQLRGRMGDDAKSSRALEAIIKETERIEHIIRSFLSLARGEVPTTQSVDPATLVREAQRLVEHRFRKAGVPLSVRTSPRLPCTPCNADLMVQVLVNLALNACDACEGGGSVEVRASEVGDKIELTVEDGGSGISEQAARHATEPFFTTKPAERGSGLGLAIANEIVKHHRGTLHIGPRRDGRGTVASVLLPAVPCTGAT